MKWLLITTAQRTAQRLGSNVGDEFARMGTERVIRAVDPDAEFILLDKEDPDAWGPVPFDKAVVCGMPLFWSLPGNECRKVWWWPPILRWWPSAVRENFLVFGAGHVFADRISSLLEYAAAIQEVVLRSYALTVREPIIDHPRVLDTICPSAFCLLDAPVRRTHKLCNLMRGGGHFGYLHDGFSEEWDRATAPLLTTILQEQGFAFVAHTQDEVVFARELGWAADRIRFFESAQGYLDLYAQAACYFGNRMHGAAVVASTGAPTWACTHDSRVGMVRRLGGMATRMDEVTTDALMAWLVAPPSAGRVATPFDIRTEFDRMVALMGRFAKAEAVRPWTE